MLKKLTEYEIGSSTIAIVPLDDETSKVYEEEEQYIVKQSSNSIIKYNCEFYGSSYDGRCVGTKFLTGIKSKCPIIVEESRNLIFFPTSSVRDKQSTWIALNKIKSYRKNLKNNGEIIFNNNNSLPLNISFHSLENQIVRATVLKSKLYELKNEEIQ